MLKIPVGWLQLKKRRSRLAVALAGVSFAVVLILMQLGFRESLFESSVRYHETLEYDIALFSHESPYLVSPKTFSSRRLYQAAALDSVESVSPVYIDQAYWKNPESHESRFIFLMGFRLTDEVLDVPGVVENLDKISRRDVVLYDRKSRPEFGPVVERFESGQEVTAEMYGRRVTIGGLFEMGTSFGIDASVITSDVNFLRIFPNRSPGSINLGLIRLREGADLATVQREIRELLPADVLVLTRDEFVARERAYWDATTPIGYIFAFGMLMGCVVGGIIVYQILFADVSDHLAEYATLKAIGYGDGAVSLVVLQQALILALLGYLPAFALCLWLYDLTANATGLPVHMTLDRAALVFGLALGMCSIAGLSALRVVRSADPAEFF